MLSVIGISSIQIFVILAIMEYFAYLIRAVEMKPYHINNSVGIKLLTRLRLSFSLLHENRFRHNFKNTLNFLCSCSTEPATTTHFFCAVTSTVKTKHSSQITWKILINLFLHEMKLILQICYFMVAKILRTKKITQY